MNVLERLQDYVEKEGLFDPQDTILLAVSGGKDSMFMANLFCKAGYNIALAHCNFQLRGLASDLDEELVRNFAEDHGIPFYVRRFETERYASERRISIQMAARELRYSWFEEIRRENGYRVVAIAQHLNDHIETVLLNLTRGTGLQGLQGIMPKRDSIIRPLLFLKADEIERYVKEYAIPYRDDQSNFSTKYTRNKIRLEIVPKFKEIQPDFETLFGHNIAHFRESYDLLQRFIAPIRAQLLQQMDDGWFVLKEDLEAYIEDLPMLFELFSEFHFSKPVLRDLQLAWSREPGRIFQSDQYDMLLDRDAIFIREKEFLSEDEALITSETSTVEWKQLCFSCEITNDLGIVWDRNWAKLDCDLLIFPLTIRSWQKGDTFYPLGMDGKKKLSDFFINQKISLFEKQQIPVVVNGNGEILWIGGYRLDNRYKITANTKKVLTLVVRRSDA